jgi:hypothetical protein
MVAGSTTRILIVEAAELMSTGMMGDVFGITSAR